MLKLPEKDIIDMYKSGKCSKHISMKYNCSHSTILRLLIRNNVPRRKVSDLNICTRETSLTNEQKQIITGLLLNRLIIFLIILSASVFWTLFNCNSVFVSPLNLQHASNRFRPTSQYSDEISVAMKFLPVFLHATAVVPLPEKPSKTMPPAGDRHDTICSTTLNGFCDGCSISPFLSSTI